MTERDDFWDISKLVPKKHSSAAPFVTKQQLKDVYVPGDKPKASEDRSINQSNDESADRQSFEYLGGSTLIKRVTVLKFVDKYDFYGSFRKAALLYYDVRGKKCDFVPFFSYMPQYSQLNQAQKNYYFFWRDEIRRGVYLKADYSYIYLFVYEILNLPDKIEPIRGIELLLDIWLAYGKDFPNINSQMSLWVQDYCLMYNLPCPNEKMQGIISEAIRSTEFIEFYLSDIEHISFELTEALLAHLSYYDWRRGKYAGGESRAIYRKHLVGAMHLLLSELIYSNKLFANKEQLLKLSRPSFRGSLCTHSVKARLEVEYYGINSSESLREAVTEALRYTENQLRALLGVKSRLAIKNLPDDFKRTVDLYFSEVFASVQKKRREENKPDYEKLYDGTKEVLSFADADEIEKVSWESTERLVEDTEDEEMIAVIQPINEPDTFEAEDIVRENINSYMLSELDVNYLDALLCGNDDKKLSAVLSSGELEEGIIDRINEAFSENFGDIIIDISSGNAEIIEDYREDLTKWLEKIQK